MKMKTIIIIPARGGSVGIPGKNIKELGGKPLINYTVELAMRIAAAEDICVSTDSVEIKNTVEGLGLEVPFLRPAELASNTSGTYEVLLHALDYFKKMGRVYDTVLLLQPTSPFRREHHIREAFAMWNNDLDMVVSVKETKSNPYFTLFEEDNEGYLNHSKIGNFSRRQDCPKVFEYNGAIYIINVNSLLQKPIIEFVKVRKYVMDEYSSLDLDSMLDWKLAELIIDESL